MKSFKETVQENAAAPSRIRQGVAQAMSATESAGSIEEADIHYVKGWWKIGKDTPHLFKYKEHADEIISIDPKVKHFAKKIKYNLQNYDNLDSVLDFAMKNGWVRFGKFRSSIHGEQFFIHFNSDLGPKVFRTAIKIMNWFDLDGEDEVSLSGDSEELYSNYHLDRVVKASVARRLLRKLAGESTMTAAESAGTASSRVIDDYDDIGHGKVGPYQIYYFDGKTKLIVSNIRRNGDSYRHENLIKSPTFKKLNIVPYDGKEITGRYETDSGLLSISLGSDYDHYGRRVPPNFLNKLLDKFPNIKETYLQRWFGPIRKVSLSDILNESSYTEYFSMWWKNGEPEPLYMWNDNEEHSEVIVRLVPNLYTGAYEKVKEDPFYYWKTVVARAIRNGYIRVGKFDTSIHGKELFIQFDPNIKGIWKTVYKILSWVDIENDEKVLLVRGANPDSRSNLITKAEAMRLATQTSRRVKTTVA